MADFDFGLGDSQYVFTDRELNDLLGAIEQKAAGAEAELEVLDFLRTEGKEPLALQFQPHSHKDDTLAQSVAAVKQEDLPVSAFSSALASPAETPVIQQPSADQSYFSGSTTDMPMLAMQNTAPLPAFALSGTMVGAGATAPFLPALVVPAPQPVPTQTQLPQSPTVSQLLPVPAAPMPIARFASGPAAATSKASANHAAASEPKGQVSHSTVEKQRRDRINSLIDELRELVPPQRSNNNGGGAGEAGMEARRPKHVVLADTIQLLKHLQEKLQVTTIEAGQQQHQADDDTANSEGKSKGSCSQDEMDMTGAPQMPHIPCQMTQNAGVTVERGPDCYYVQVKCRDRKGLLSDIINALRQLPLEIRTASVTTTNGLVRDVFEVVQLDDPAASSSSSSCCCPLSPEDLQNLVHDVLFQQHCFYHHHQQHNNYLNQQQLQQQQQQQFLMSHGGQQYAVQQQFDTSSVGKRPRA